MTTIEQNGGTITISQVDGYFKYIKSIDLSEHIINFFPIIFKNTTTTSEILTVSINSELKINEDFYFICGSSNITINGQDKTITYTADSKKNTFNGLVQNGTDSTNGFSNVKIEKIKIEPGPNSYLSDGQGWICQSYFGRGASNNQILNCINKGPISFLSGGICGSYAGSFGGNLAISNCGNSGVIFEVSGGICGPNAAYNGTLTITYCYSDVNATINGPNSAGILGPYSCGGNNGTVNIDRCYSSGNMVNSSCGIVSKPDNFSKLSITNCYSRGTIGNKCCGIALAANNISNCYSSGAINTKGKGQGQGLFSEAISSSNNYATNGANNWSDANANTNLIGFPSSTQDPGTIWKSNESNTPYFLV
jgi:hypothetical protein